MIFSLLFFRWPLLPKPLEKFNTLDLTDNLWIMCQRVQVSAFLKVIFIDSKRVQRETYFAHALIFILFFSNFFIFFCSTFLLWFFSPYYWFHLPYRSSSFKYFLLWCWRKLPTYWKYAGVLWGSTATPTAPTWWGLCWIPP